MNLRGSVRGTWEELDMGKGENVNTVLEYV